MNLNANEFLALDTIMNGMNDVGDKLDMVELVKAGKWEHGGHGETCVEEIAARLEISVNAAKGYIGSLIKKDLVENVYEDGMLLITAEGVLEWDKR